VPVLVGAIAVVGGAAWVVTSHRSPAQKPAPVAAEVAPPHAPAPVPSAVVEPAKPAPEIVVDPPAPEPVVVHVAKVAPTRPHKRHDEKAHKALAQTVHVDPPTAPVTQPVVAPVAAPTAPVPAPPPPTPLPVHAAIAGVDVHGSLPAADVRRAVDRALPAIEHCSPAAAQNVVAELTIGENRRAEGVRASGGSAANCVSSALASVRTESAPDVGEVEVTVHVKFAETK
jgi:hypothetical protein